MKKRLQFKNRRLEKGYSLRVLGRIIGINYQKINRFENGEATLTEEELIRLENFLDINTNTPTSYTLSSQKIFEEFYEAYVFDVLDFETYKTHTQECTKRLSDKIIFMIIEYGMLVMQGYCNEAVVLEKKIDKYLIPTIFINSAYLDFKGCRLLLDNDQESAMKLFESALSIADNENLSAMIHYHISILLKEKNHLKNAIKELTIAQEVFNKTHNFKRLFGSKMMIAIIKMRDREYDEALVYYKNCLSITNIVKIEQLEIAKLYRNMTWLMIRKEDYEDARYYVEKARNLESNHKLMYLYSIWINYKKENYVDAIKEIKKCKRIINDQETLLILELFLKLCSTKNKMPSIRTFNFIIKIYKIIEKKNDVDLMLFYLDIVLDMAERRNDLESIVYYQKILINLLKR